MYIEYRVQIQGITLETRMQITPDVTNISYITLTYVETRELFDDLYIRFYFSEALSNLDEMESSASPVLEDIINLVIYKFNVSLKTPTIHSYKTPEVTVNGTGAIEIISLTQQAFEETGLEWLQSEIEIDDLTCRLSSNVNFILYKSILSIEDEIARFLLLYAILYDIKGNQPKVDKYIREKEPTVKVFESTDKGKKEPETIYTYWRNQSQHIQKDTDFEKVKDMYRELVNPLQYLVFEAVKNQV